MAIYDYLPTFHVLEPNILKGLQPGFVEALAPVAASTLINGSKVSGKKFVENGQLAMYKKGEGKVEMDAWKSLAGENPVMFITWTEPINKGFESDKFFAVDLDDELPRFVQLIPGDEWMTDIDYELSGNEELAKHVVEMTGAANTDVAWYGVKTLADGTPAHHYKYIG